MGSRKHYYALTLPQKRALRVLARSYVWMSAQQMQEKERTLEILVQRGLAERREPLTRAAYWPDEYRLLPGKGSLMTAKQCDIQTKHPHHEWTDPGRSGRPDAVRWCAGIDVR